MSVTTRQLSSTDIAHGQRLVRRFATLNGVSVALLMDNMLILYAIRNGLGDTSVALLASFIHLTMPLMLIGKELTKRIGAARTWGTGWILRNASALIMVLAPFLGADAPQAARTAIVLAGGLGFAAFRSIGLVGNSPVMGEITDEDGRGRFMSGNWTRATITQIVCLIGVIVVLGLSPQTWVFQLLIAIGGVVGIYVGWLLTRVPETDVPRHSARLPLREVLARVWHERRLRKTLFAWAAGIAAFTLVLPFATITLKNGYGLSDYQALLFTLVTLSGGVAASLVNGVVADVVGPRPLAIIYLTLLAAIGAWWSLAPDRILIVPTILSFFLAGYSKFGLLLVTNHYFLNVTNGSDRVGASMVMRIVAGSTAGLIGGVIGGAILGLLGSAGLESMDVYRAYFRIATVVLIALVPTAWRLDRLDEWPVRSAALLLLRPWRVWRMRRERDRADYGK